MPAPMYHATYRSRPDFETLNLQLTPVPAPTTTNHFVVRPSLNQRSSTESITLPVEEARKLLKAYDKYTDPIVSTVKGIVQDFIPLIKELGLNGRARMAVYAGAEYIVLEGYAGLRKILTAPRYKVTNLKIKDFVIGKTALARSAMEGTAVSFLIVGVVDVVNIINDHESWRILLPTLAVDETKVVFANLIAFGAAALVATTTAPVWVPVAIGLVVGVAAGLLIDHCLDTGKFVNALPGYIHSLEQKANEGKKWLSHEEQHLIDWLDSLVW